LTSFVPAMVGVPRNRIGAGRPLRFSLHACLIVLVVAILSLTACSSPPKRAPIASKPAQAISHVPGTVVLDPLNQERDKKRIKQALASGRDSLASTEVGYYMDVLQGRLKQLADKRMAVTRVDDRIILALSLRFESGSTRIDSGIAEILSPLSSALVEYRKTLVSVHIGADADMPALAEQRARVVAQYLVNAGVQRKRVVIAGSAENQPLPASQENSTRVELQLEPVVRSVSAER
jgi:outer membrane protein OmpA-like peptidoglycan-associated protein